MALVIVLSGENDEGIPMELLEQISEFLKSQTYSEDSMHWVDGADWKACDLLNSVLALSDVGG